MERALGPSVFFGLSAMTGWGINSLLTASLTRKLGSFRAGFLVQVLTLFPTALLFPLFKDQLLSGSDLLPLSLLGILGSIAYLTYTKGFSEGAVSIVFPITSTWAVITAVLSFVFLKERVILLKIIGIGVAILGIISISADFKKIFKKKKVKLFAGSKWAALTALGWGVNFFLLAFFSRKLGWYSATLGLRFWSTLFFLGLACLTKNRIPQLLKNIPPLAWVVILIDTFTLSMFNIGVTRGEPAVVSVVSSAAPLVAAVLARIFLKETISSIQKLGIVLCLISIATLSLA